MTSLWAEYELLDSPARRRRWAFKVHARAGRRLAADPWAACGLGLTVPFRGLDVDTTGKTYAVRIVGISEKVPKPADGARWDARD